MKICDSVTIGDYAFKSTIEFGGDRVISIETLDGKLIAYLENKAIIDLVKFLVRNMK